MRQVNNFENSWTQHFLEFDMDTVENILNYAYTGYLHISERTVQNLMMGAAYFQLVSIEFEFCNSNVGVNCI